MNMAEERWGINRFFAGSMCFSLLLCSCLTIVGVIGYWFLAKPKPPPDMVFIPAGEFVMGSDEGDEMADSDEFPQRLIYLDSFYIDKYEVTNEQFARFVEATGYLTDAERQGWGYTLTKRGWDKVNGADWRHPYGPGSDIRDKMNHPVVLVSWNDADAYCRWAGKRLPTEAEWEKAARGTDGRRFPWGNTSPESKKLNFCDSNCDFTWREEGIDDGYKHTAPVGSYTAGASPYGVLDMAGNVWEWVADWYDHYNPSPGPNPQGPKSGKCKVARGGAWTSSELDVRSANRVCGLPFNRIAFTGFRCAWPLFSITNDQ
jgi:formylglycine-generating enzyme required for sulfatase activity